MMDQDHDPTDRRRGQRHLRVGIELSSEGAAITSMWVVDQPAIQPYELPRALVAWTLVGGRVVLVESFDDPRILRGIAPPQMIGHHFGVAPAGTLYVSIPFSQVAELTDVRVRLAARADLPTASIDAATVAGLVDAKGVRPIVELGTAQLRAHRDWAGVAKALGLPSHDGRFEIYVDGAGEHRWRLRGPGGAVVAECSRGFATRAQCEEELAWLRANARTMPVTSLDVGSPGTSSTP